MSIIHEQRIRKRVKVLIKKGKHAGKTAGDIIYEDGKFPYYFVQKSFTKNQMWRKPQFMELVSISKNIVEELIEKDVRNVLFQFIGFEKESFFVQIPVKDFLKGRLFNYDDLQYCIQWTKYPRLYKEQEVLI